MKIYEFNYHLPDDCIALRPVAPRSQSKMLVYRQQELTDSKINHIDQFFNAGDRLIVNNTKVIPAALEGLRKPRTQNGQSVRAVKIALNLDRQISPHQWLAMAKPMRRLKSGDCLVFSADLQCKVEQVQGRFCKVKFNLAGDKFFLELAAIGLSPLPPYIASKRKVDAQDKKDYQTVFARKSGAVAAPTASLHFDEGILNKLDSKGVDISEVTLHVGSGTFLPITDDNITRHQMHSEWGEVSAATVAEIVATKRNGGKIIAVGTTSLRLIETVARRSPLEAWSGLTDLFIQPGFEFRIVDALVTNFHLPKSSLLVLVSAFVGHNSMHKIYQHALNQGYRFLSYGDSSLLFRER